MQILCKLYKVANFTTVNKGECSQIGYKKNHCKLSLPRRKNIIYICYADSGIFIENLILYLRKLSSAIIKQSDYVECLLIKQEYKKNIFSVT